MYACTSESAEGEMPFSADQFVDSVGLNVRLSYSDWPTATNWDYPDPDQNIKNLIAELGIRHLRDRIPHPDLQPVISFVSPHLASLYQDFGMKFIVGVDTRNDNGILDPTKVPAFIDWYATGAIASESGEKVLVREMIEAIEGPNEYDRHHNPKKREDNWASNLNAYQSEIYRAVQRSPKLASLPVVAPSLIHTEYCRSPLSSFEESADLGNLHAYPNYPYMRYPLGKLDWHLQRVTACTGDAPVWVTETGYATVKNDPEEISEKTAAKYTPRLLTEYFLTQKIKRTYIHEIARGSVDRWGLVAAKPNKGNANRNLQYDLRPKPAYYAVRSLLNLLSEAVWIPEQRRWEAPEVELRPARFSIEDANDSTHHLLLQKQDEHYFLLLWQEVESYTPDDGNYEVPPDPITVKLNSAYQILGLHEYNENFEYVRHSLNVNNKTVAINVPDRVTVLEFSK